jgi:hypothetical protein
MNRGTKTLTASENIRANLSQGNAMLVQLTGTDFSGSIDFKSSDGVSWANHPYELQHSITPSPSLAQITSVTSSVSYLIKPPLLDCRIDCVVNSGSLNVVFREVTKEN